MSTTMQPTASAPTGSETASCCAYCSVVDGALKARTPAEQKRIVGKIEAYDLSRVREKMMRDEALAPGVIDEAIAEYRKFLILQALGHIHIAMISREVDEVWHNHILFTREYAAFCQDAFGYFMHHQPSLPSDPMGPEPRENFLAAYRATFGDPPAIWNVEANATCGVAGCVTCCTGT